MFSELFWEFFQHNPVYSDCVPYHSVGLVSGGLLVFVFKYCLFSVVYAAFTMQLGVRKQYHFYLNYFIWLSVFFLLLAQSYFCLVFLCGTKKLCLCVEIISFMIKDISLFLNITLQTINLLWRYIYHICRFSHLGGIYWNIHLFIIFVFVIYKCAFIFAHGH